MKGPKGVDGGRGCQEVERNGETRGEVSGERG